VRDVQRRLADNGGVPRVEPRRLRPAGLVLLLGLGAALLAATAGWEAHRARQTAERVLRDYATIIADRLVDGSARRFHTTVGLWSTSSTMGESPLGALLRAHAGSMSAGRADPLLIPQLPAVRYAFVYDVRTKRLVLSEPGPPPEERSMLVDTLRATTFSCGGSCLHPFGRLSRLTASVAPREVEWGGVLETDPRGELRWIYGVRLDPRAAIESYLVPLVHNAQMCQCPATVLPGSLSHLTDARRAASFIVRDASGQELYRSEPHYPEGPTVTSDLSPDMPLGGLTLEVAVNPREVGPLLPYGGRGAPWALFAILSLVALGSALLAALALRREASLARARQDFVANVSHEIRTPLARIRLFNELLAGGKQEKAEKRGHYHAVIDRECQRLTLLVDNLLHLSRLERMTERYDCQPLSLRPVVEQAVDAFRVIVGQGTSRLTVKLDDVPPVRGDAHALQQVVINLLDNALKYSPDDAPVEVRLATVGDLAELSVTDHGSGVPEGEQERIFEPFYRVHRSGGQSVAGNGLGLALVRRTVQAHQGQVGVTSTLGEGSTFCVRLPLVPAALQVQPSTAP
jgi:signal transduction histidine kinase